MWYIILGRYRGNAQAHFNGAPSRGRRQFHVPKNENNNLSCDDGRAIRM